MEIPGISRAASPGLAGTKLRYSTKAEGREGKGLAFTYDSFSFDELLDLARVGAEARAGFADRHRLAIQPGGWQSWSAGWELVGRESLPRRVFGLPPLIKYTNRDGDDPRPREIVGHFICYLRAGDDYVCVASMDGGVLPPTSFRFDRSGGRMSAEAYEAGKDRGAGEAVAEIEIFHARGFFDLRDKLRLIYRNGEAIGRLDFLRGGTPGKDGGGGGFETWYHHYSNINERLILDDLEALDRTENLANLRFVRRGRPMVFQIDDGWQRSLGDWEIDRTRFPRGLAPVTQAITEKGYIPGLWFAPFLVLPRGELCRTRPEWLLRDRSGRPVVAGWNDKWGKTFHCLDLSRPEVLDYLRSLMDRAIDEWGFRFLKLDFLYAGLLSGAFAGGGAAWEHYRKAVTALTARKTDGEGRPVAYLGCGIPFGPSYRHFPLSRIGADTKEDWEYPIARLLGHVGRPSAFVSLMDTIGRAYLDGAVLVNDPDVVFLRKVDCRLTENEKELIALGNFLLGGWIMVSDDPESAEPGLTARIAGLYEELSMPGPGCPVEEYGAVRIAPEVFRLESRSRTVSGILNLSDRRFRLRRERAEGLYDGLAASLAAGTALVDHCVIDAAAAVRRRSPLVFAPRSITLVRV